jgi:hypothetical protein
MDNRFYLPILKAKYGEFQALSKLNVNIRRRVFPLLEITSVTWDHEENTKPISIEDHLNKTAKKLIEHWPFNKTFIDVSQIANEKADGISAIEYLYKRFFEKGLTPIPVISKTSPGTLIDGVSRIQQKYNIGSAAIRITLNDLSSLEFRKHLDNLVTSQNASIENIHMILDLGAPESFDDMEAFTDAIVSRLGTFPYFSQWGSFSICGSAYPQKELVKDKTNYIPRNEWKLYLNVVDSLAVETFNRPINYGDYSIVAPGHFEFDRRRMQTSAKMIYTLTDDYVFLKGESLKKKGFRQYINQASEIVCADYFMGEQFSAGDRELKDCYANQTKTGTATIWNWVGNNHHITKIVKDLFSN